MAYIDSHAHLCGPQYQDDIKPIIAGFPANDISRVLLICCDDEEYKEALCLAKDYDYFDIAKGIHPEAATSDQSENLAILEKQLSSGKIAVLGEIGLDYYWIKDNKEYQKELFISQLHLADKFGLAVSIHCREASEDMYNVLKEQHHSKRGVMHCYSGSVEMMERFTKLGYYISLAGPVTFKNARLAKEVAKAIPNDRLLYETDSPYLTPVPYRGKRNNPNLVIYVARMIAELREIDVKALNDMVSKNYQRLLGGHNE